MEKWEDEKDFSFSHLCSIERVKKWRDGKFFCLVENKVCINLLKTVFLKKKEQKQKPTKINEKINI